MASLIVAGFPPGATVTAYEAGMSVPLPPPGNAPSGIPTESVIAVDGVATFNNLAYAASYILYCAPSQYVRASTPDAPVTGATGTASASVIEDVTTGWAGRPDVTGVVTWIGWTDPTAYMAEYDLYIAVPEPLP